MPISTTDGFVADMGIDVCCAELILVCYPMTRYPSWNGLAAKPAMRYQPVAPM